VGRRKTLAAGQDVQFIPETARSIYQRWRDGDWHPATYVEHMVSLRGWHRVRGPNGELSIVPSRRIRDRVTRIRGLRASLSRRRPTIDPRDLPARDNPPTQEREDG